MGPRPVTSCQNPGKTLLVLRYLLNMGYYCGDYQRKRAFLTASSAAGSQPRLFCRAGSDAAEHLRSLKLTPAFPQHLSSRFSSAAETVHEDALSSLSLRRKANILLHLFSDRSALRNSSAVGPFRLNAMVARVLTASIFMLAARAAGL